MSIRISQARKAAFKVLLKFEKGEIKFLKESLNQYIEDHKMQKNDLALATDIVYGVMRWRGLLDFKISKFSNKKISSIDKEVLIILRISVYQLLFLNKIPPRAVVDEGAKLAYYFRKRSAADFINGILREFLRRRDELDKASSHEEDIDALSNLYSHPKWMFERWMSRFGLKGVKRLCKFNNEIPPNAIRVNTIKITRSQLAELFKEQKIECEFSKYCEDGLIVPSLQGITQNPLFKKGYFYIQDEGSMLVSRILKPEPGENILDLCSAPGGKTTHIAQIIGNKGLIIAIDNNFRRLLMIKENCSRMGFSAVKITCGDGRECGSLIKMNFDKVLVDAPCSGTGILRRNPEIKWARSYNDIVDLKKLQKEILNNACYCVKPDGVLVYSTCSIELEENQEVIESFLSNHKNFILKKITDEIPQEAKKFITKEGYFQSLPNIADNSSPDAFFVAKMKKVS